MPPPQLQTTGLSCSTPRSTASIEFFRRVAIDHLNAGYLQLGLFARAFGGLKIWWISSTLRGRRRARRMNEQEFKRSLERIWAREEQRP